MTRAGRTSFPWGALVPPLLALAVAALAWYANAPAWSPNAPAPETCAYGCTMHRILPDPRDNEGY